MDTPQVAYTVYAEAINQGRWCDAIATFDDASKPRVAVSNFKSLALLAGGANPKRRDYAAALKQLCLREQLECASDAWLARFVPATMNGGKAEAQLASVTKRAEAQPDSLYLEVMQALQSVDAAALAHLDPVLRNVENRGETAVGLAHRAGSMPFQLTFVHSERGWKNTMAK